jgi:CheY-like chemotaxis protein
MPLKILIAEDEKDIADLYGKILSRRGHQVTVTFNGKDCVNEYVATLLNKDVRPYDVVVIDYSMPVMTGAEAAKRILDENPEQKVVFISAHGSELLANLEGMESVDFLTKPTIPEDVVTLVETD